MQKLLNTFLNLTHETLECSSALFSLLQHSGAYKNYLHSLIIHHDFLAKIVKCTYDHDFSINSVVIYIGAGEQWTLCVREMCWMLNVCHYISHLNHRQPFLNDFCCEWKLYFSSWNFRGRIEMKNSNRSRLCGMEMSLFLSTSRKVILDCIVTIRDDKEKRNEQTQRQ